MKTLGILGGLGVEATMRFYQQYLSLYSNQRPPTLVWSVSIDVQKEKRFISSGKGKGYYVPLLLEGVTRLIHGGAEFIVMPCNSLHTYARHIASSARVPFINMIEEAVKEIRGDELRRVGILGTPFTIRNRVYENVLDQNKIQNVIPTLVQQQKITLVIINLLSKIRSKKDRQKIISVIKELKTKGAEGIILGCSELSLLGIHSTVGIKIYDPIKIIAQACYKYAMGNL